MRTRRRTYTAATPSSLLPKALTTKPIVEPCTANPRGSKRDKCCRYWDLIIPLELLQEILSRLGFKANIQASVVCKTWREAAVSVRKLQPRPWLFYPQDNIWSRDCSDYVLTDLFGSQTYNLNFPGLKSYEIRGSRDGWLLVFDMCYSLTYLLNLFTRERIDLPKDSSSIRRALAFSAAPTSSSCLVVSFTQPSGYSSLVIKTWRPGATLWTTHCFENHLPGYRWIYCVFTNGMCYCLSNGFHIGVFDPCRATWNILPVKPCPAKESFWHVFMTEHEGVIFLKNFKEKNSPLIKLNLKRNVWEEKRELGGLTKFETSKSFLLRSGISAVERNRIDTVYTNLNGISYYFDDDKISSPPTRYHYLSTRFTWVDPPDSVNL